MNNNESTRGPYQSTLRARMREQTSQIILDAVGSVIRNADIAAVSVAEVARVAEVTEQTIYRHYGSRDELIRAFIKWHLEQVVGGPDRKLPSTIDELLAWVGMRYQTWEDDRQVVSEAYLSPIGRELRQPLYEIGFENLVRMLTLENPDFDESTRRHVAASMLTLMSTENFVFLKRNLGFDAAEAHAVVATAIGAIRRGVRPSDRPVPQTRKAAPP
ncbi:MAG: TetR/AcrR family transcriptional regulator [Caulobacter sp.]|nr:TetR/AcrR family transcriptional regulator [Caulobacter sp.]